MAKATIWVKDEQGEQTAVGTFPTQKEALADANAVEGQEGVVEIIVRKGESKTGEIVNRRVLASDADSTNGSEDSTNGKAEEKPKPKAIPLPEGIAASMAKIDPESRAVKFEINVAMSQRMKAEAEKHANKAQKAVIASATDSKYNVWITMQDLAQLDALVGFAAKRIEANKDSDDKADKSYVRTLRTMVKKAELFRVHFGGEAKAEEEDQVAEKAEEVTTEAK